MSYKITIFQCLNKQNSHVLIYVLQTVYYYFLGLKIGNEHKSMFYRTQQKHELMHQFNVACFYSCLFHFLFYKVNFILFSTKIPARDNCYGGNLNA